MHTLLVLSLLRCRKTSDMDHTHTLTTDSSLLRDGRVSSYISLLLNTSISLSQQLYRPPLIWPLARLGQTVWRLPGCLPVSPTALTSTTTLSGTNRKIKCFRQLSISCSNFLLNTDFNTHTHVSLLFRYHPIDDVDDITETSVEDGSNRVVLRSKLQQKQHTDTQTTTWHVMCLDLEYKILF